MYRIIKTELWKLKRYHVIWAGILLMLLSVGITLFASTALDGTVWTFSHLVEQVIQNNATTIFPMCITLIAGYIIAREKTDDTLKNIMTIPVSYSALIGGKLVVCGVLSVFFGIVSTAFTIAAELLVGFPGLSAAAIIRALIQITFNSLLLYVAVTPIIAVTARISEGHMVGVILAFVYGYGGMFAAGNMTLANLYPITASMGLIQYRSHDAAIHWNIGLCSLSMIAVLLISVAIVVTTKMFHPQKLLKSRKKPPSKKAGKQEDVHMKKKILIGIGAVAFVAICFGIFLLSGAGSTYYYSQIDNTKIEQTESAGGVINFGGSMDYSYTLRCYDEDGNEKDITFGTSRKLKEDAFIRLTVMPIRGVLEWIEVQYDELPAVVQKEYSAPQ